MNISVSRQAFVFLGMVLCGIMCGVVFDVFRGLRRYRKTAGGVVALQDILFWIIELAVVYMAAFRLNYAHVRAYEGIALVMGSWVYFMTASEYVIRFVCSLTAFLVRTVCVIFKPFAAAGRLILRVLRRLYRGLHSGLASVWRKVGFGRIRDAIGSLFHPKAENSKKV